MLFVLGPPSPLLSHQGPQAAPPPALVPCKPLSQPTVLLPETPFQPPAVLTGNPRVPCSARPQPSQPRGAPTSRPLSCSGPLSTSSFPWEHPTLCGQLLLIFGVSDEMSCFLAEISPPCTHPPLCPRLAQAPALHCVFLSLGFLAPVWVTPAPPGQPKHPLKEGGVKSKERAQPPPCGSPCLGHAVALFSLSGSAFQEPEPLYDCDRAGGGEPAWRSTPAQECDGAGGEPAWRNTPLGPSASRQACPSPHCPKPLWWHLSRGLVQSQTRWLVCGLPQ